jgi:hypothetical protein
LDTNQQRRNAVRLRALRFFLGAAALGWIVCFYGVFASWPALLGGLEGFGAHPIAYDPMLEYWFRMFAGAFGLIGVWYTMLMIWPRKFAVAIPWFGIIMLVEGIILLVHGVRLSLPPFPFYGDTAACFVIGGGIVYLAPAARAENKE